MDQNKIIFLKKLLSMSNEGIWDLYNTLILPDDYDIHSKLGQWKLEETSKELNKRLTEIKFFEKDKISNCLHPKTKREYIGRNMLRCKVCDEEFY